MTFPIGTVVKVTKSSNGKYQALLPDGRDVTDQFENYQLRNAVKKNCALKLTGTNAGTSQWRSVAMAEFTEHAKAAVPDVNEDVGHDTILDFLRGAAAVRPSTYKMDDLKWRFAVRTVLRGKNMMIVGPRGCGKTVLAFTLADVLDRELFNIPLGATQDPRSVLIGNTHFRANEGTYVVQSEFVRAIQTKNAIVLLDEITRAHPDAWNILMPVLDYKQRFLRIDEDPNIPTIEVAEGVTFIATANIGAQYTATRTLDAALLDRFITIEIDPLDKEREMELLQSRFPQVPTSIRNAIVNIAVEVRKEAKNTDPRLSDIISTRSTLEMAELIFDGFSLIEASELVIFPQFSEAGGTDSERSYVRQIVQKHLPTNLDDKQSPYEMDKDADQDLPWDPNP